MKILSIITAGTVLLSIDPSFAADPASGAKPLTRAEVKKSVLDARASGELNTGDDSNYPYIRPQTTGKSIKRKHRSGQSAAATRAARPPES